MVQQQTLTPVADMLMVHKVRSSLLSSSYFYIHSLDDNPRTEPTFARLGI